MQEQSDWPDGSAIRLTIARYYTPTGRCIQRPYDEGTKKYYEDFYEDMAWTMESEKSRPDSTIADSLKYTTPRGKTGYGGGGITPDIFVPVDTIGGSMYLSELNYNGIFRNFSFDYVDKHRAELNKYENPETFEEKFLITNELLEELYQKAEQSGIQKREKEIQKSEERIRMLLKANMARYLWHNEGFYKLISSSDSMLKKAVEL